MLALKLRRCPKRSHSVLFEIKYEINIHLKYLYLHVCLYTADDEEKKVGSIAEEVKKKQRDCEEDLVKAEPALLAAQVST